MSAPLSPELVALAQDLKAAIDARTRAAAANKRASTEYHVAYSEIEKKVTALRNDGNALYKSLLDEPNRVLNAANEAVRAARIALESAMCGQPPHPGM